MLGVRIIFGCVFVIGVLGVAKLFDEIGDTGELVVIVLLGSFWLYALAVRVVNALTD